MSTYLHVIIHSDGVGAALLPSPDPVTLVQDVDDDDPEEGMPPAHLMGADVEAFDVDAREAALLMAEALGVTLSDLAPVEEYTDGYGEGVTHVWRATPGRG